MTRGRPAAQAPADKTVELNTEAVAEAQTAMNTLALVEEAKLQYSQDRDLANQMLGQIQMSRAISKFTDVVSLSKLKVIKETKLYRSVAGQKAVDSSGNEIADVGTWAGFCAALGVSASKIDEDLTNLKVFGEDALEQMQRIGIGYRELRQYRKLPEDQKLALIEVAKAGDKEGFVELAEEIIAKHAREKETLAKELEAKEHRIAESSQRINALEDQVSRRAVMTDAERLADDQAHALKQFRVTVSHIKGDLRGAFAALMAHEKTGDHSHRHVMAGYLAELQRELDILRGDFFLPEAAQAVGA